MARAFAAKRGRIVGRMDAGEIDIVIRLLTQTRDLVAPLHPQTGDPLMDVLAGLGTDEPAPLEPTDPALRRLLPPGHRSDHEQAAEFRALTEQSLRSRKTRTLEGAIAALEQMKPPTVDLSRAQAQSLLVGLTDVRLVLGERLGLRTDEDAELLNEELSQAMTGHHDALPGDEQEAEPDEQRRVRLQQAVAYDFLSWIQESLSVAVLQS